MERDQLVPMFLPPSPAAQMLLDQERLIEQISAAFKIDHLAPERPPSAAQEYARQAALAKARHDEAIIREMLGRWVSELEPSYCLYHGNVIGLAVADDPTGTICVRPPLEQFQHDMLAHWVRTIEAETGIVFPREG